MKQITRQNRRIAREAVEEEFRIEREKRQKQYMEEKRKEFFKSSFKVLSIMILIAVPVSIMIHYNNIDSANYKAQIDNKLAKWNDYKNKNCKESEKLYGMQMGSGKFGYFDNGIVYTCDNNIKYTVSDKAASGNAGLDSIPDVK